MLVYVSVFFLRIGHRGTLFDTDFWNVKSCILHGYFHKPTERGNMFLFCFFFGLLKYQADL